MDPGLAFGIILREVRLDAKLTQEQVALLAGLDRTFISLIERGRRQPTVRVIFQLATALGTTAGALIIATEQMAEAAKVTED